MRRNAQNGASQRARVIIDDVSMVRVRSPLPSARPALEELVLQRAVHGIL